MFRAKALAAGAEKSYSSLNSLIAVLGWPLVWPLPSKGCGPPQPDVSLFHFVCSMEWDSPRTLSVDQFSKIPAFPHRIVVSVGNKVDGVLAHTGF